MIIKIINVIKTVLSPKVFGLIMFIIRSIGAFASAANDKSLTNTISNITKIVDNTVEGLPESMTVKYAKQINKDEQEYKGFTATLIADKHGDGNTGIELSYTDGTTTVTYDPTDGSIKGTIGIRLG